MADAEANIDINIDTSIGIQQLKLLQAEISNLNRQLLKSGAQQIRSAENIQRNLLNNINATGKFAASVRTISSTAESFTNSLEKNKFSMGEYFRYAGASTKTFGRLFTKEFDTIEKVARERVKTLQTQFIKLGRDGSGAIKAIAVRPLSLDMENLSTKTAIAAQKQQIFNQLVKQGSTNLLNFGKNTQWAGRQLMVGFSIPLAYLGATASKTFMEMEKQAIRFKRVYGDTFTATAETDKMISQVKQLASEFTKYGVAVEKTMGMAADAAAMGKMGADLLAQVKQAATLAVLGGVEQDQALETTISLTNAFGIAAEELAGKIDFLNAVENQTVTAIEDLTIAIPKAAPVIKQLGGDVEDLAFFLTAMKEGGINASEGANALKSGLASLINPTEKASKFLQGFGINIKGIVDANKGDVKGLVVDFAQALDTLDPLNRARAIEQLFGKFQFARLSTLFQNVIAEGTQAERVLKLSASTAAELAILSERELKRIEESPMYKFQKAVEDLKVSLVPLGEAFLKAVTPLVEFAKGFLDNFNNMSDSAKNFAVIATTAIAGIGPILLMTFGLIANGVANIIKLFANVSKIFKGTGVASTELGAQTEYMTQQQLEAAAIAGSLDQVHSKLIQTFTSEAAAVNQLATAYGRAVVNQSKLLGIDPTTGLPIASTNKVASRKGKAAKPAQYAGGVLSVPGPKGAGDVVPAMLSPGEAVIPAKQSQKYAGLISGMINDDIPGFRFGFNPFKMMLRNSRVATRMRSGTLESMLANKDFQYRSAFETGTGRDFTRSGGRSNIYGELLRTQMEEAVMGIPRKAPTSQRPTYGSVELNPIGRLLSRLFGLSGKQFRSISSPSNKYLDLYGDTTLVGKRGLNKRSTVYAGDLLKQFGYNEAHYGYRRRQGETGNLLPSMLGASPEQLDRSARFWQFPHPFGKPIPRGVSANGTKSFTSNPGSPYIEAHVAGGFNLNEISKIRVPSRQQAKKLQKLVDQAGLKIKVTPQNAPMIVKVLANMFGTRFNGGLSVAQSQELKDIIARLKSDLRSSSDAFKKPFESLGYGSFGAEQKLIDDIYALEFKNNPEFRGLSEKKKAELLKSVTGYDLAHMIKSTRDVQIPSIDGGTTTYATKNWQTQNIQKEHRSINQILQNIVTKDNGSFLKSLNVNDIATSAKLSPKVVLGEIQRLMNDQHPNSLDGYKVLQQVVKKYGQSSAGSAALRAKAVEALLGFRISDSSSGSYIKALSDGKLTLGEIEKVNSSANRRQEGRIRTAALKVKNILAGGSLDTTPTQSKSFKNATGSPVRTSMSEILAAIARKRGIRLNSGVVSVPGTKGKGDVVPAMLTPGEAVIPAPMADKYAPLISSMISNSIPGYAGGRRGRKGSGKAGRSGGFNFGDKYTGQADIDQAIGKSIARGADSGPARKSFSGLASRVATTVSGSFNEIKTAVTTRAAVVASRFAEDREIVRRTEQNKAEKRAERSDAKRIRNADKAALKAQQSKISGTMLGPTLPSGGFTRKQEAKMAKRAVRGGRISAGVGGLGSVAGMAAMGYSMTGGPGADIAGMASLPLMMLPAILPMLTNPVGLAAVALGGLATAAFFVNEEFKKTRDKAADLALSLGSGTKTLQPIAEFAGKATATEIMTRKRQSQFAPMSKEVETYGSMFAQSEAGKSMLSGLQASISSGGRGAAQSGLFGQLSTSIASGILTSGEAVAIAQAMGKQLGDAKLGLDVTAKIVDTFGPNGESLKNNPLQVRMKLMTESGQPLAQFLQSTVSRITESGGGTTSYGLGYMQSSSASTTSEFGGRRFATAPKAATMSAGEIGQFVGQTISVLQTQREIVASSDLYYDSLIDIARAKYEETKSTKDLKKLNDLISKKEADRVALLEKGKQTTKQIVTAYTSVPAAQGQIVSGLKAQAEILYKDSPFLSTAQETIDKLDKLDLGGNEIILAATIASGDIAPDVMSSFLSGSTAAIQKDVALIISAQGAQTGLETIQLMNQFPGNEKIQKEIAFRVEEGNIDLLNKLNALGGAGAIEFFADKPKSLERIEKTFDKIEDIAASGDLTAETVIEEKIILDSAALSQFKSNQEYFNNLPEQQRKIFLQTFISTYTTMSEEEVDEYIKTKIANAGGSSSEGGKYVAMSYAGDKGKKRAQAEAAIKAAKDGLELQDAINDALGLDDGDTTGGDGGSGTPKADPFKKFATGTSAIMKQSIAMKKLVSAGVSVADAYEIVQDEELAFAIASEKSSKKIRQLVKDFETLKKAQLAARASTPEGRLGLVNEAISQIDAYYAAREAQVERDFESGTNASGKNATAYAIKTISNTISSAQKDIADYQYTIDDLQYQLSGIEEKESAINKKYNEREEALDKIWSANKAIADQQKSQLSIADALAQGDIAAAARAIQEAEQERIDKAREDQLNLLNAARDAELQKVTATNGKTRAQIEKDILDTQKLIATVEETRLEPAEKLLRYAEDAKRIALEAVSGEDYLGKNRDGWAAVEEAARLAVVQTRAYETAILDVLKAIPGLKLTTDKTGNITGASLDSSVFAAGSTSAAAEKAKLEATIKENERLIAITKDRIVTKDYDDAAQKARLIDINIDRINETKALKDKLAKMSSGGMVKRFATGGLALGTDTVPAMLTPGEFVMSRYAVSKYGVDKMKAINTGSYDSGSVYNYEVNVNVRSDANPDQIARSVMNQIRNIDSQRIRSNRF